MSEGNVFDDRTTVDLLALVRMLRSGQFEGMPRKSHAVADASATPIYIHNGSGEEIPPYACMQVTDTEEIGRQNFLVVGKPADTNANSGGYLFNGPRSIEEDGEGIAQVEQVVRGFKDTGASTGGDHWAPVVDEWHIAKQGGGPFICCGDDDVGDNVLKVFAMRPPGGDCNFFRLLEDAFGEYGPAYAMRTDRTGNENREVVKLYWWDALLSGVKAGYKSTMKRVDEDWVFEPGICPVYCYSDGSISGGSPANGTVGEAYAHTFVGSNLDDGTFAAAGLPNGLAMDSSGAVAGTPTAAGVYYIAISAAADKTGPGVLNPGDKCTVTKVSKITISPIEEE